MDVTYDTMYVLEQNFVGDFKQIDPWLLSKKARQMVGLVELLRATFLDAIKFV